MIDKWNETTKFVCTFWLVDERGCSCFPSLKYSWSGEPSKRILEWKSEIAPTVFMTLISRLRYLIIKILVGKGIALSSVIVSRHRIELDSNIDV